MIKYFFINNVLKKYLRTKLYVLTLHNETICEVI